MAAETTLLRLATAGSVDDGKSTLIGRLLHDAKAILADQYDDLQGRDGELDLSRLTDGLRAEREQGITIDVAYRYFATPAKRFILVDARQGVLEQTKRHAFIASLLGIPHLVVAINKMDLVAYSEERFDEIVRDFCTFRRKLAAPDVHFLPISARDGDNVVDRSENMPWYEGPALLKLLESIDPADDRNLEDLRFPVQLVIRADGNDYRSYAGQVASGVVTAGDRVRVLPAGTETTVAAVETPEGGHDHAVPGQSVTLRLADDVDASRGDVIVHATDEAAVVREFTADLCWFAERPLVPGARYLLKHLTHTAEAVVDSFVDLVDVHTLERTTAPAQLALNDIARVKIRTRRPLLADPYTRNRVTGAFILIDEASNDTVAGGMIAG
jgi:bifunctional enzyme CysN/CysC